MTTDLITRTKTDADLGNMIQGLTGADLDKLSAMIAMARLSQAGLPADSPLLTCVSSRPTTLDEPVADDSEPTAEQRTKMEELLARVS